MKKKNFPQESGTSNPEFVNVLAAGASTRVYVHMMCNIDDVQHVWRYAKFDAVKHCRGQSQAYSDVLSDINIFFTAVYVAEATLKNTALGPWKYVKDNW